jgi:hypothetical protein
MFVKQKTNFFTIYFISYALFIMVGEIEQFIYLFICVVLIRRTQRPRIKEKPLHKSKSSSMEKLKLIYILTTNIENVPFFQEFLEIHGFFIYLFLMATLYFLFIIYQVLLKKDDGKIHFMENHKV